MASKCLDFLFLWEDADTIFLLASQSHVGWWYLPSFNVPWLPLSLRGCWYYLSGMMVSSFLFQSVTRSYNRKSRGLIKSCLFFFTGNRNLQHCPALCCWIARAKQLEHVNRTRLCDVTRWDYHIDNAHLSKAHQATRQLTKDSGSRSTSKHDGHTTRA